MSTIGRLRERIILEAPVETADGAGGVSRSLETHATLWAQLVPVSARDTIIADSSGATVTHRITIRAGVDLTTRHRFRLGDRVFDIVTIRDADTLRRFLVIEARERVG